MLKHQMGYAELVGYVYMTQDNVMHRYPVLALFWVHCKKVVMLLHLHCVTN